MLAQKAPPQTSAGRAPGPAPTARPERTARQPDLDTKKSTKNAQRKQGVGRRGRAGGDWMGGKGDEGSDVRKGKRRVGCVEKGEGGGEKANTRGGAEAG
eukprot:2836404-Rhodomonas_salina.2